MTTHSPNFGTDSGPVCTCGSTLWTYDVKTASYYDGDYDNMDNRSDIDCRCVSCGARSSFETRSKLETIEGVRSQHENHVAATAQAAKWAALASEVR